MDPGDPLPADDARAPAEGETGVPVPPAPPPALTPASVEGAALRAGPVPPARPLPPAPRGPRPDVVTIALATFALAFAVRLVWVLYVQRPQTAVYSDMGGYVYRANDLLAGRYSGDPRMAAFYPWGTHTVLAGLFKLFGQESSAIGVIQALVGAIPAPCCALIMARLVPHRVAVAAAGVVMALWHPHITYSAFFMSEVWFTTGIVLASWFGLRYLEGKRGAFAAGLAIAFSFVVRPQAIVTVGMVALALVPSLVARLRDRRLAKYRGAWLRRMVGRHARGVLLLLGPFIVVFGASAVRLHRLSGHYGLISENGPVQKLFADTDVGKIEATWYRNGQAYSAWFSPGTKHPLAPNAIVKMDGYIADPEILERIRLERLRGVPLSARVVRLYENVKFLVFRSYPNPEGDFVQKPWRFWLLRHFRLVTINILPLAGIGAVVIWKKRAGILVNANLATIIFIAAFYFAEARYRVPYDPFLILVVIAGIAGIFQAMQWILAKLRRRAATPEPATAPTTPADATDPTAPAPTGLDAT